MLPSSMYLCNPPYGSAASAYHHDYGSPYGPCHLSGPPLHYDGGSMLPPGGLYGVPPLMDRYGMPLRHGPMMFALMPELITLPPYMGPAPPSMRARDEHYDYGSPYGPHHLSRPPLHNDGGAGAMLPPGGLYGVPPPMDRYGMPMRHGPMAPRTGSYLEESSQRNPKGCENDWICPTCGNNYPSTQPEHAELQVKRSN